MTDILTGIVVFCAAATATACAVAKLIIESGECKIKNVELRMESVELRNLSHLIENEPILHSTFSIFNSKFSIHTAVFVFFATVATLSAQKTNSPLRGGSVELKMENVELRNSPQFTKGEQNHNSPFYILHSQFSSPADVARGYRLEYEFTNAAYSYAMPTNGLRYGKWWKRGAFEDVFRLDLGGMRFPLAGEVLDSLWVYSWGMAGAHLRDASNRLVATGVPMSAVPGRSEFWSADAAEGAKLLTWENFFLNRDTNTPVSAQLELYPSGNFIARSNNVERLYHRVNPDDWDDDGIPNDEDDEPYTYDGDFFGPHQVLPTGANTNHYYWVDVVVDCANAHIVFEGDGYSHLPDPDFVARAGDTNRVMLLMGKSYSTRCDMPVRVVGREDDDITVLRDGDSVSIVWPVHVNFVPIMRSGHATGVEIHPQRADGGSLSWPGNFCCYTFVGGVMPIFDCDGTCGCGGCSTGDITYEVGGYQMSYGGFFCCCSSDNPDDGGHGDDGDPRDPHSGPSVSMSFSNSTIVFEDGYANSVNDVVQRQSTDTELTCEVYGGTNGGRYAFMLYDNGRLLRKSGSNIPRSGTVEPGELFRIKVKFEAQGASGSANDISAVGTFTENDNGAAIFSEATLTAVKVEICPIVEREGYPNRHRMGIRERFQVITHPSSVQCSVQCAQDWTVTNGIPIECQCPIFAGANGIELNIAGETYTPNLTVVEPDGIVCSRGWDRCTSECVAMELEPLVTPLDVSFQGIAMMEVPTTTVGPSGYFTNEVFSSVWYHTSFRGAGVWHNVQSGNYFFKDEPAFAETCPQPFFDGTIDWEIVLGWNERDSLPIASPVATIATHYHQVFTIDAQGSIRIDKFGQWIQQFANGAVTNSSGIIRTRSVP